MLRIFIFVTIVLTFLLINLGGYVHNTGSSLACPDWPLCYGQIMPKMEGSILIEHGHRMLASFVGFLCIVLMVFAWQTKNRYWLKTSAALLVMVIAQGVLGGMTVIYKLPSLVSTLHLGLSVFFFCSLIYFYYLTAEKKSTLNISPATRSLLLISLIFIYGQMIIGALMRHLGLGGVCGVGYENSIQCFDMIDFQQVWFPASIQARIHVFHRYFAIFISFLVFVSSYKIVRSVTSLSEKLLGLLPSILVVFQIALGVMTVGTNLSELVTTLHLGVGVLLISTVWILVIKSNELAQYSNSYLNDLLSLGKPRLSGLVIFTTAIGMYLAPEHVSLLSGFMAVVATSMLVAGACAINCYMERDIDGLMKRTESRPLPSKRMDSLVARNLGICLIIISVLLLFSFVNIITAVLGVIATFIYVVFYTPMKQKSPHAVFVGAIPGAIPPLMGWTAVTGQIDLLGILLFALLFVWQLPHFLAISLFYSQDYERAQIKIYPTTNGKKVTTFLIFIFTLCLSLCSLAPSWFGIANNTYYYLALSFSLAFTLFAFYGLTLEKDDARGLRWAKNYFWGSLIYLPAVMTGLLIFH
ncbi:MAG: protoheme IX farnesyltransferase [Bacteriovoracaceae bacterium]|nr:protoheme IX farnesyltransferase [Bacteriovoracaceae bacterium]